ncbi:MAG: 3-deoxy-7-phosphoheptulonate synthase [Acidobacteria bacterium]|nr:3-deoxy-7-phosphoheptulonate synthase [Acidobacteriota bacterium]
MVILLPKKIKQQTIIEIKKLLEKNGVNFAIQKTERQNLIIIAGTMSDKIVKEFRKIAKIDEILENEKEYFLCSKRSCNKRKSFKIGNFIWNKDKILLAAGPCAIENEKTLENVAKTVKNLGAQILRGGSFKPRTSPYSFQGLGEEGLKIHRKVCDRFKLLMMSEVLEKNDLPVICDYSDIIQIGSRNMQNFPLLKAVGKLDKPVLLKRNFGSTREEFLLAAEYILSEGNDKVILCERGVKGFDPAGKNVFDPASLQKLKEETFLPIIVDPSHSAGDSKYVETIAKAALVSGADGLMIEVHPNPKNAFSDAQQALNLKEFENLICGLKKICKAIGKRME